MGEEVGWRGDVDGNVNKKDRNKEKRDVDKSFTSLRTIHEGAAVLPAVTGQQ